MGQPVNHRAFLPNLYWNNEIEVNNVGQPGLDDSPLLLRDLDCLLMNELSNKPQWLLHRGKEQCLVRIKPQFCCDDFNVLRCLAEDDAGIAVLPDYICDEPLKNGSLVRVLPQWLSNLNSV